jgi:GGDEF domain-containing protein
MTFAQAYRCADQALYAAKAAGRNCVQRSMVSEASLS